MDCVFRKLGVVLTCGNYSDVESCSDRVRDKQVCGASVEKHGEAAGPA